MSHPFDNSPQKELQSDGKIEQKRPSGKHTITRFYVVPGKEDLLSLAIRLLVVSKAVLVWIFQMMKVSRSGGSIVVVLRSTNPNMLSRKGGVSLVAA